MFPISTQIATRNTRSDGFKVTQGLTQAKSHFKAQQMARAQQCSTPRIRPCPFANLYTVPGRTSIKSGPKFLQPPLESVENPMADVVLGEGRFQNPRNQAMHSRTSLIAHHLAESNLTPVRHPELNDVLTKWSLIDC